MPENLITLDQLRSMAAAHLPAADLDTLDRACAFAKERHGDMPYNYGGTFLGHVPAVAATLVSMKMDLTTITAGLLHGVINEGVGTLARLKKDSFAWYQHVIATNGAEL